MEYKIGAVFIYGGSGVEQSFEIIGSEPWKRRDGAESNIWIWQGQCLVCGAGFQFKTGALKTPRVTRTCLKHRETFQDCSPRARIKKVNRAARAFAQT